MDKLFARARNNLALAPAERALLKLIEGLACAALVAALPILADALGHGAVDWAAVGRTALAAGATAALVALLKYCKAFGDPPLPSPQAQPSPPWRAAQP
jgi:hypothetical protein